MVGVDGSSRWHAYMTTQADCLLAVKLSQLFTEDGTNESTHADDTWHVQLNASRLGLMADSQCAHGG